MYLQRQPDAGLSPRPAGAAISFGDYMAGRRYAYSNLSRDAWDFLLFALGRPEYLRVSSWTDLKGLNEAVGVDERLRRGAYRLWQSYLRMRSRSR